jgi:hypothetical protein
VSDGLEKINQLNPVNFKWKVPRAHGNRAGGTSFLAQEFGLVFPECVQVSPVKDLEKDLVEGNTALTIVPDILPHLVSAVQQLSAQVTALQDEISKLRDQRCPSCSLETLPPSS